MPDIGRNDPCPCGSGRKYKYCCLHHPKVKPSSPKDGPAAALWKEFQASRPPAEFHTFEEMSDAFAEWVTARNARPLDDFIGLSPEQVGLLLERFFDVVQVAGRVTSVPPALPFVVLDALLETDMGGGRVRIDELPDKPLDLALERMASNELFQDMTETGQVRLLDVSFLLLRTVGIVRRYRGRFIIGREFRDSVHARDYGALYPVLFRAMCTRIAWGVPLPRSRFEFFYGFILYLLYRQDGTDCTMSALMDPFFTAFPMLLEELESAEDEDGPAADFPFVVFHVGVVINFLGVLGLVEDLGVEVDAWIRPHPALQELLTFPPTWRRIWSS